MPLYFEEQKRSSLETKRHEWLRTFRRVIQWVGYYKAEESPGVSSCPEDNQAPKPQYTPQVSSHTGDDIAHDLATAANTPTITGFELLEPSKSRGVRRADRAASQVSAQSMNPGDHHAEQAQTTPGFLSNATHCTFHDTVMNLNYQDNEQAMMSLANHTIRGAEFDSSDRDPPPKCHPGTRESIIVKAKRWLHDDGRQKRILWFVGFAGAGKSAIMQTLSEFASESPDLMLGATLFFSKPNGRKNPAQVFITIAYQIAIKCLSYRQFVLREFATDPDLPRKAMKIQFTRLIVEPFVRRKIYEGPQDLLVFLDGLDECEDDRAQCEIISLISSFSLAHPNTPLVWVLASRPESHLQTLFSRESVIPSYEKEEVPHDSEQACIDVEHYLTAEFQRIKNDNPMTRTYPKWPTETELRVLTTAAVGLFAFASTAVKFIDDPTHRNPIAGLALLLASIKRASVRPSKGRAHPLAQLDALYTCILSQIPEGIFPDTNVLLTNYFALRNTPGVSRRYNLKFLCNWASMIPSDAYSALDRLHSILTVPSPESAEIKGLSFHHRSFSEYLRDRKRSHKFHISDTAMDEQEVECSFRIVKEAHLAAPTQARIDAPLSGVALTWPATKKESMQDALPRRAIWGISGIVRRYDPALTLQKLQDPQMIQIARSLDFAGSYTYYSYMPVGFVRFMYHIQHRLDARLYAELKRLNLLREILIGELPLSHIEDKRLSYCRCDSSEGLPDLGGIATAWKGGEFGYDDHWGFIQVNRVPAQVILDLRNAQAQSPNTPVLLFGNATHMYLICELTKSNGSQRWTYYLPFRFEPRLCSQPLNSSESD